MTPLPIEDVYDTISGVYDSLYTRPQDQEENELLVQTYRDLPPSPSKSQSGSEVVADIGCGTGLTLDLGLPDPHDHYIAVDPSEKMLLRLHEKHHGRASVHLNADLRGYINKVRSGELPRPDRLLVLFGVPSYCHPDDLKEALDILAPGGSAIFLPYDDSYLPAYHGNSILPRHTINRDSLHLLRSIPGMAERRLTNHYLLTYTKPVRAVSLSSRYTPPTHTDTNQEATHE